MFLKEWKWAKLEKALCYLQIKENKKLIENIKFLRTISPQIFIKKIIYEKHEVHGVH